MRRVNKLAPASPTADPGGPFWVAYGAVFVGMGMVGRNLVLRARLANAKREGDGTTGKSR